jgi:hypothetical protein
MKLTQATTEKLALAGALGIAFYIVWRKASNTLEPVSNTIADAILGVTLPGDVQVVGTILLPNGNVIPVNGLAVDSQARFTYLGARYQLTGRNSNNQYVAVRV